MVTGLKRQTLALLFFAGFSLTIHPPRKPYPPTGEGETLLDFKTATSHSSLVPLILTFEWILGGNDGDYVDMDTDNSLVVRNILDPTNHTAILTHSDHIPPYAYEYFVKPDRSKVLWATNHTQLHRHSYLADYFIQDVETQELTPLITGQAGDVQYATWSPVDNIIAYVYKNNLFLWRDGRNVQITWEGSPDMFKGVADWVYEEEIFSDRQALWFSPDGKYLAFLEFDEAKVPIETILSYMATETEALLYPEKVVIHYPKVTTNNPEVYLNLLEISSHKRTVVPIDSFSRDNLIVGEVVWLTRGHGSLALRTYNRVQNQEKIVLVDVGTMTTSVVRERFATDGWLENPMSIKYIGELQPEMGASSHHYFADISDESGWSHIYLFPCEQGEPIQLTSGNWDVTEILYVDLERKLIYFLSTENHPTERHLYSVSYISHEKTPLVDDKVPAWWSASFSTGGGYYVLTYGGPDVPYQEAHSVKEPSKVVDIMDNEQVVEELKEYKLPNISFFDLTIESDITVSVMQRLPASFTQGKKYPVLFIPYGGPGSQEVTKAWKPLDWKAYISSDQELEYIIWTVDGRGTGFRGRKFLTSVYKRLGQLEVQDQIAAAKLLSQESFVDKDHIGIWGWSYGGYLAAKVIEANSSIFSFGMMTAPVVDWRLYDSFYTERYMENYNEEEYQKSAVHEPEGFLHLAGKILVQQGTADDNVLFEHSAALVEILMSSDVPPHKLSVQWFTDGDHSISEPTSSLFLYKQLTGMLYEEKNRDPNKHEHHEWDRRSWKSRMGTGSQERSKKPGTHQWRF
ncbi:hypothetical protein ACJ72_03622 [Emergomyces africanus]|uniref:dipeptidyl-peptidase IV n=1 Tax=Emergomyces africanus TaxID=1955775 RepID=A0A1B7NZ46_9EURO|nr:hypothetical protein ACJ72_03622 [Emergomyces africanus]